MTSVWIKQALAITSLELRRYIAARRWVGVYLLAALHILLFLPRAILGRHMQPSRMDLMYADIFQAYVLRFAIFISCGIVFSQLFRGETLEKTLHFYLLTPVRREIIAAGKYLAALVMVAGIFWTSIITSFLLLYLPGDVALGTLARYLAVAALACVTYGAIFILLGVLFKNPSFPGFLLLGWENVSFALPRTLQRLSINHYLQTLLPVQVDRFPFAIIIEPTPAILSIPGLLCFALVLVAVTGWRARHLEVTYGAD